VQVEITVNKGTIDNKGVFTPDAVAPLKYKSDAFVTADTDCQILIKVPSTAKGKCWEVYVEAGQQDYLSFSPSAQHNLRPPRPPRDRADKFPKGSISCAGKSGRQIKLTHRRSTWKGPWPTGKSVAPLFCGGRYRSPDTVGSSNPSSLSR